MTASAQIGTLRGVPNSTSISLDSGASVKGGSNGTAPQLNFRSVLEQHHASHESTSEQGASQRKQNDTEPATSPVPQPAAPAEAPRVIHPLTTSITLRQDETSAPDETADPDATASAEDATAQDSAVVSDQNGSPTAIATISPTPTILRGTLSLYSLPRVSDAKTNRAAPTKSPLKSKDSVPPQTAAAPPAAAEADPSIPIRLTSSTTLEQATTAVQNSSTVNEAPYIASASTSERQIAYQYRSSNERPTEAAVRNRVSQQQQKVSDLTVAVTVPASLAPQPPVSNTLRQDAKAKASGPTQDSSPASGTDLKSTLPPDVDRVDDTAAATNTGAIAFAARLTPNGESQAPASESTRPADPLPGSQASPQLATPINVKQIATTTDVSADGHRDESGSQSNKEKASDLFAKVDTLPPQMHAVAGDQTAAPANNQASNSPLSPAAQMGRVIDPPAVAPKTNNDITIRIPDSTGQDTAVRFVERAGEVHVSVRTGDPEMAQSLRGGLNDLVNRLEDGGIRTEVWQPGSGANASTSQNDSHQTFADPDGSNGRQYSNSDQQSRQQNKPRWVEELEGSIGNPNFKETTQSLWQA